ncbi:hypothetical protein GLYMA_02G272500v4 [Glycine max]|uniref:SHSP domain-containing protein n=2 Tax=Glycine subgen. Soja TaxID=1462606 RepID=K7KB29_SOYBN|nr:probable serine/threonine-protein kinase samkC [Glycine max]XP_028218793.1 probable serine/threonine-protein kinase samkC [Glycine soja]KAG5064525.1 hypothetical protein JHK85_005708 [Glycine max]KAG5081485.1 hypothetical protein JHK86_005550 [Glycine max]KAH1062343.1 hypothetical protein GYH30_005370 [Glycine max]KHN38455.1 hypothetical protein glysoja_004120 [Glycine soja]KRH73426.1 hypothetical protein GLYMA_02G272500v4 [Glycine max]|eukprot:XP_006575595.1 probable serine/threonine-protein kinase samkC [Glycine max]
MSDEKTNVQPTAEPANEDFLPPSDWDRQNDSDTLILMLPGFRKEQMKVQVTSNRMLRVSGGRKISENKFRQFRKEEPLSDFHDTKGITAKFEAGMLYVRIPKVFKPQPPPTQQEEPSKPQPTTTKQEPSKPQPPPTQLEPPMPQPLKHQPPPTTTQQEPSKPQKTTKTYHKPHAPQQHVDEKETKEDKISGEYSKTKTQTPLPQEPIKAAHDEDSQKKPQKEMMSKAETEEKSKTSEAQEMHGTTQTTFKEQNEDDRGVDSQKKDKGKLAETDGNDIKEEAITSKAQKTCPDELSKRSNVAMMHKILAMISDFVLEVKKQSKVPHFVVLFILVLLIGYYINSRVKSSFGGPNNQEL